MDKEKPKKKKVSASERTNCEATQQMLEKARRDGVTIDEPAGTIDCHLAATKLTRAGRFYYDVRLTESSGYITQFTGADDQPADFTVTQDVTR